MKKLFFCTLALTFALNLSAQITFETSAWADVKAKATRENKLIFLDAYADWCGPCIWMAKNTFKDTKVGEYFNENFINYKLDLEKGEGIQFAKDYPVDAYPTLFFIKGDGEVFHTEVGAQNVQQLLALGKDVQTKNNGGTGSTTPEELTEDDWNELNNKAWAVYENGETNTQKLKEAVEWAEKSIVLQKNSYNTDTLAHLLYKLGKKYDALKWANESIKLAQATDVDTTGTKKLIQKIKGEK